MDRKEEYHDPDYPETLAGAAEVAPGTSEAGKIEKIKKIVSREFSAELNARENEIMLIDQRSTTARRMLQRLRYIVVNNYYMKESLKMTQGQLQDEVAGQVEPRARGVVGGILRDPQRRLHPSVRKLLGKQSTPVDLHEILFRRCAPRNKGKKDYQAMVQSKNYTVAADTTKSLRPSDLQEEADELPIRPKKIPRRLDPKITNVVTLDEATRNQMKHRYRIIIGNTSKYAPSASSMDRSTHKWLLYVRGPPSAPDLTGVLTGVTVRLHHSYAPHHTVHIDAPPFHVSRRGWGEFPARVQLHFPQPHRNRPATLTHTIALDRTYSRVQTCGAETVVDVWLYSTEEMLKKEFKEDETETIKREPIDPEPLGPETLDPEPLDQEAQTELAQEMVTLEPQSMNENIFANTDTDKQTDSWLDFFSNTTELDVDEMIIKPTKKIDEKNDLENMIESNVISKENEQIDIEPVIKQELIEDGNIEHEPYKIKKEIEDLPNELLSQTNSPKKRIMKYMDPTTGKIYYLEMDRKLDLTKVQEIVINSKGNIKTAKISPIKPNGLKNVRKSKKGGVSLLKPEVKSLLKNESSKPENKVQNQKPINDLTHIENDHCYLGPVPYREPTHSSLSTLKEIINEDLVKVKKEKNVYECICGVLRRFTSVRVAVDYCLKKIPLVNSDARDPDFVQCFPFVVETAEKYWKLDFAKRRNIEWSRSKLINKLLTEHLHTTETIWRTKQILIYSRLRGYFPIRPDALEPPTINQSIWSSWDVDTYKETDIKEMYPNANSICSLSKFNPDDFSQNLSESIDISDSDEEIEIVDVQEDKRVKKEVLPESSSGLTVLPVQDRHERLRYMFLERKCADIGIELRNEDVGNGYSYSAVHAVLLSAMKSFAEDVIRGALAERLQEERRNHPLPPVWMGSSSSVPLVRLGCVYRSLLGSRLQAISNTHLQHHNPNNIEHL